MWWKTILLEDKNFEDLKFLKTFIINFNQRFFGQKRPPVDGKQIKLEVEDHEFL